MQVTKEITYIFTNDDNDNNFDKVIRDIKNDLYSLNDSEIEIKQYATPFDIRLTATLPLTPSEQEQLNYLLNK